METESQYEKEFREAKGLALAHIKALEEKVQAITIEGKPTNWGIIGDLKHISIRLAETLSPR